MELKIGRDTLLAISAVAWADGSMDAARGQRATPGRQAARHPRRAIWAEVERALAAPVTLDEVETVRHEPPDAACSPTPRASG